MIESDHGLRVSARLGATDSLPCTGTGNAYLAEIEPRSTERPLAQVQTAGSPAAVRA